MCVAVFEAAGGEAEEGAAGADVEHFSVGPRLDFGVLADDEVRVGIVAHGGVHHTFLCFRTYGGG